MASAVVDHREPAGGGMDISVHRLGTQVGPAVVVGVDDQDVRLARSGRFHDGRTYLRRADRKTSCAKDDQQHGGKKATAIVFCKAHGSDLWNKKSEYDAYGFILKTGGS